MKKEKMPYAEYWFPFREYDTIDLVIQILRDLSIPELRTCFSWADWEREGGPQWFNYFISKLESADIRLMPCLFYTPPQLAMEKPGEDPKTSFPPKYLEEFALFARTMIDRYGHTFDWVQFWNEPNWQVYWDQELDPDGRLFAQMIHPAIDCAHEKGKKVVLGGLSPYEPEWVERMHRYGILQKSDAVGIHAFPGTWDEGMDRRTDRPWTGLSDEINHLRDQLKSLGSDAECWYTETGYSTFGDEVEQREREIGQVEFFDELVMCTADRAYWHTVIDQRPDTPTDNTLNMGLDQDVRAYHFGITDVSGNPKLLYYYWRNRS